MAVFCYNVNVNYQRKLDKIFSEYIRRRDANKQEIVKCYCGALNHWKDCDASHFVSRQHLATRYDEKNVCASCRKCNRFLEGNKESYAEYIITKYGCDTIKELNQKKYKPVWNFPYEKLIDEYKEKLKNIV